MRFLCKLGIHSWEYGYDKLTWQEYEDSDRNGSFYMNNHGNIEYAPKRSTLFYLVDSKKMGKLPINFINFHKKNNSDIFKRFKICSCGRKKQLKTSICEYEEFDSWEVDDLSQKDIRDIKLNDLLDES